ncbi:MAG TPA: porin family protein [Chitinophagaceae bacterium]|nr:porin family protein [Chitinophagaceae bacterium]
MNKYIALFGLILSPLFVKAQYVKIGPELGATYSTMSQTHQSETYNSQYQMGFKLGVNIDVEINNDFYIQTGLYYKNGIGAHTSFEDRFSTGAGLPTSVYDRREYSVNAVHIPVYAMYKTGKEFDDSKFFVGAGPFIDINTGGRFFQEYTRALNGVGIAEKYDDVLRLGKGPDKHFQRVNVGIAATLGYEFSFGLYIKADYGLGFLNMAPLADGNNKLYSHGGGLSIGFLLPTVDRQF